MNIFLVKITDKIFVFFLFNIKITHIILKLFNFIKINIIILPQDLFINFRLECKSNLKFFISKFHFPLKNE